MVPAGDRIRLTPPARASRHSPSRRLRRGQVNRDQRRRTGRVDGYGRALQAEGEGDPSGGGVQGRACRRVELDLVGRPEQGVLRVIVGADPDEHPRLVARAGGRPACSKASHATSSSSRCCGSSVVASRGDRRKKPGSKVETSSDRKPPRRVYILPGVEGSGVEERLDVPACGGHLARGVAAFHQGRPECVGTVDAAWEAAAQADHGDRFAPPALGLAQLAAQVADLVQRPLDDGLAVQFRRCVGHGAAPSSSPASNASNSASDAPSSSSRASAASACGVHAGPERRPVDGRSGPRCWGSGRPRSPAR